MKFNARHLGITASLFAVGASLGLAPGASAAITIGQTFQPTAVCGVNTTSLQTSSPAHQYEAPVAGTITSWSFQGPVDQVPELKLKVARRAGDDSFKIIGESPLVASLTAALNTFPVQIPVQAGDLIGLYTKNGGKCANFSGPEYGQHYLLSEAMVNSSQPFIPTPSVQIDVSATIETETGLRAAALKKCKKKHSRKARKRCKKKARRLPV